MSSTPLSRVSLLEDIFSPAHGDFADATTPTGRRSSIFEVPVLKEDPPKLDITLLSHKLVSRVIGTCVFLIIFTAVAYVGIPVKHSTQLSGDTKANANVEKDVELFNTISGFLVTLVETMLGVYMSDFLPAFQVYLHNSLWYLQGRKITWVRSGLMLFFPVLLMLLLGQSMRSFQAAQSSVGFETVMQVDDLAQEVSTIELLKLNSTLLKTAAAKANVSGVASPKGLGVLKGAVNGTTIPFDMKIDSPCAQQHSGLRIGLHDIDSVNVVYGFPPNEWYSEMLDDELDSTYDADYYYNGTTHVNDENSTETIKFNLTLAAEMFAAGKVLLDRGVAETMTQYDECGKSDTRTLDQLLRDEVQSSDPKVRAQAKCAGSFRSLVEIGAFQKLPEAQKTPAALMNIIATSLAVAVDGLDLNKTEINFRRYDLTEQIQLESIIITATVGINETATGFFTEKGVYEYGALAKNLCGPTNCVFIDPNNNFLLPRQILQLPVQQDCQFTKEGVSYVKDLRSFLPSGCRNVPNSSLAVAITSFISADVFGSNITSYNASYTSGTPFLINPERVLRITLTKLNWQTASLDSSFHTECHRSDGKNCTGLAYRLTKTGRFVFASDDTLPIAAINGSSLAAPIRLLQLNQGRFYVDRWKQQVMPERLTVSLASLWGQLNWTQKLRDKKCSSLMDSYISHITNNSYFLERPFQQLVQASMYYLFAKGSVTELNETSLAFNASLASNSGLDKLLEERALANIRLKGDSQYRQIRVRVPLNTFRATAVGCGVLALIAVLVVVFPTRAMAYMAPDSTTPECYIKAMNSETYPDTVHVKTLLFPVSGERLPMQDFVVDEITLVQRHIEDVEEITF